MRRSDSSPSISMFPFLSVLCTVIGVLVLFIVLVLSTRVVQEEELVRRTEAHDRRPRPGAPEAVEQGVSPETYEQLEAGLAALSERLQQRRRDRSQLKQRLAAVEDLLEYKKTRQTLVAQPPPARPLVQPERVHVTPAPTGIKDDGVKVTLRPILVECAASGYTMHPSKERFPLVEGDLSELDKLTVDAALKRFLKQVDGRKQREYLVFLIHPNGVEAFRALRRYVENEHAKVRIGWEPFAREWLVTNQ